MYIFIFRIVFLKLNLKNQKYTQWFFNPLEAREGVSHYHQILLKLLLYIIKWNSEGGLQHELLMFKN
jgi:hypothetical protein